MAHFCATPESRMGPASIPIWIGPASIPNWTGLDLYQSGQSQLLYQVGQGQTLYKSGQAEPHSIFQSGTGIFYNLSGTRIEVWHIPGGMYCKISQFLIGKRPTGPGYMRKRANSDGIIWQSISLANGMLTGCWKSKIIGHHQKC